MTPERITSGLRRAMEFARHETQADRAIVVYEGQGEAFGFANLASLWRDGDLSLAMLRRFLDNKQAALIKDSLEDPEFGSRTSAVLSNLGSVLFVPIRSAAGSIRGFLYLDQRGRATFLSPGFFERVKRFVSDELEPMMHPPARDLEWSEVTSTNWVNLPS